MGGGTTEIGSSSDRSMATRSMTSVVAAMDVATRGARLTVVAPMHSRPLGAHDRVTMARHHLDHLNLEQEVKSTETDDGTRFWQPTNAGYSKVYAKTEKRGTRAAH